MYDPHLLFTNQELCLGEYEQLIRQKLKICGPIMGAQFQEILDYLENLDYDNTLFPTLKNDPECTWARVGRISVMKTYPERLPRI